MKLTKLLRVLRKGGCHLDREGARHSVWINPATGQAEAVPRHKEINTNTAVGICRKLSVPPPTEK